MPKSLWVCCYIGILSLFWLIDPCVAHVDPCVVINSLLKTCAFTDVLQVVWICLGPKGHRLKTSLCYRRVKGREVTSHHIYPSLQFFMLPGCFLHLILGIIADSTGKFIFLPLLSVIVAQQFCIIWRGAGSTVSLKNFACFYLHNTMLLHYSCLFLQGWAGSWCCGVRAVVTGW